MNFSELTLNPRAQLILPSDSSYDKAKNVWNGLYEGIKPAAVVRVAGAADVKACIKYVKESKITTHIGNNKIEKIPFAVRSGGGHDMAGMSTVEGGLVIDLQFLKGIYVDLNKQTVKVEPGVILRELDHELLELGYVTTTGNHSDTGVAGFALHGGHSWISTTYGFAVDNLVSVDWVTAEGELLHIDENHHPDLFWAVRGAGNALGIATCFEFKIYPMKPNVYIGIESYPIEEAKPLLKKYRDLIRAENNRFLSFSLVIGIAPPPVLKPAFTFIAVYYGNHAEEDTAKWKNLGTPLSALWTYMKYTQFQALSDAAPGPEGRRIYEKGATMHLDDETVDVAIDNYLNRTSFGSFILITPFMGAEKERDSSRTSFQVEGDYLVMFIAAWMPNVANGDSHIQWAEKSFKSIQHKNLSLMMNFSFGDYADYTKPVNGPLVFGRNLEKLKDIKKKYDPEIMFIVFAKK